MESLVRQAGNDIPLNALKRDLRFYSDREFQSAGAGAFPGRIPAFLQDQH